MGKKFIQIVDDGEVAPTLPHGTAVRLLSAYLVPDILIGTGYAKVNKANPCPSWSLHNGGEFSFWMEVHMYVQLTLEK